MSTAFERTRLTRITKRTFFPVLAVSLVLAGSLAAQRPPEGRRGGPDRAQLEQRFRAQMARVMKERLGLDDAQAERLSEVVREYDGRRRELARAEFATRRRVEALMLEGGTDEAEAQQLLDRMLELRRQEGALFEEEQVALREVLSATQVLQLHDLREELGRRIRSLRGGDGDSTRRRRRGSGNVDGLRGVGLSL